MSSFLSQMQSLSTHYIVSQDVSSITKEFQELCTLYNSHTNFNNDYRVCISNYSISQILSLTFSILSALKSVSASLYISQWLIKSIGLLKSENPEYDVEIKEFAKQNIACIDPEILNEFSNFFFLQIKTSEIIEYALYLVLLKQERKAISMLKSFECLV